MENKTKIVTGLTCPKCEEFIWSRHQHDFCYCKCGYCFVDGGDSYFRCGWGGSEEKYGPREEQNRPESETRELTLIEKKI